MPHIHQPECPWPHTRQVDGVTVKEECRLTLEKRPGPACPLTKAECDQRWTAYLHKHEGQPCSKMAMPGYKRPVCIAGMTPEEIEAKLSKRVKSDQAPDELPGQ